MSLSDLEQLETASQKRVSELLIDWANGPESGLPFHSFYAYRTRGEPISNEHVGQLAYDDLRNSQMVLFGKIV